MKRRVYQMGVAGRKYGIWNVFQKCWQFGVVEDTPMLAEARLYQRIGDDAKKWQFEVRELPQSKIVKSKRPCKLCEQKPHICCGEYEQASSQIQLVEGNWTSLYAGKDKENRLFLCAHGDGYTDLWYPNFCPECGRKLYGSGDGNG